MSVLFRFFVFRRFSREVLKKRDENSPADISSSHNRDVHGAPWGSARTYEYAVVMATKILKGGANMRCPAPLVV